MVCSIDDTISVKSRSPGPFFKEDSSATHFVFRSSYKCKQIVSIAPLPLLKKTSRQRTKSFGSECKAHCHVSNNSSDLHGSNKHCSGH